jgi:hypothetical protein
VKFRYLITVEVLPAAGPKEVFNATRDAIEHHLAQTCNVVNPPLSSSVRVESVQSGAGAFEFPEFPKFPEFPRFPEWPDPPKSARGRLNRFCEKWGLRPLDVVSLVLWTAVAVFCLWKLLIP